MTNALLVAIDFINDIVHSEGKISFSAQYVEENHVIEHANCAIQKAKKSGIPVVYVKVGFSKHYLECPKTSPIFCRAHENRALELGTWGTEFHEDLVFSCDDYVITKHRISALYGTDLETVLRANNITTVFLCGVSTDLTINVTARELHDRDYMVTVLEDACGTSDESIQTQTINSLRRVSTIANSHSFL